jgi:hypothetical protein
MIFRKEELEIGFICLEGFLPLLVFLFNIEKTLVFSSMLLTLNLFNWK